MSNPAFTTDLWRRFFYAQTDFEESLTGAQPDLDWDKNWYDPYDESIEFSEVPPDVRLNEAVQRILFDAGFLKAFVNHSDGWETHYSWGAKFKKHNGWRTKGPALLDATRKRRGTG